MSVKQLVINMTSEERKALRDLIDVVEANSPKAETVVEAAPTPTKKAKAAEAEADSAAE